MRLPILKLIFKGVIQVNIIVFLLFGSIVGWLASVIMKTSSQQGLLGDIILGTPVGRGFGLPG